MAESEFPRDPFLPSFKSMSSGHQWASPFGELWEGEPAFPPNPGKGASGPTPHYLLSYITSKAKPMKAPKMKQEKRGIGPPWLRVFRISNFD